MDAGTSRGAMTIGGVDHRHRRAPRAPVRHRLRRLELGRGTRASASSSPAGSSSRSRRRSAPRSPRSSARSGPGSPPRSTPSATASSSAPSPTSTSCEFDGIVLQAVGRTVGVLAMMLFLYATRIIKVTDKLRMGIVPPTGAIVPRVRVQPRAAAVRRRAAVPARQPAASASSSASPSSWSPSLNLLLDFDFIERGAAAGAPEVHGVVRRLRSAGHARVALPRAAAAALQAAR